MQMKSQKASVDIIILVLMTVVLSGWALFTFVSNSGYVGGEIKSVKFLENIYVQESAADFYINFILDETLKEIDFNGNVKEQFIEKFNTNFLKYRGNYGFLYFDFNEGFANLENVWIEDGNIYLKTNFKGSERFGDRIKVSFSLEKVFVRDLN